MNSALRRRKIRLSDKGIFILVLTLLLAGAVGKAIFENALLGEGSIQSESFLKNAGIALGLQAISTVAIPIFVYLLFEEIEKAENQYKLLYDLFVLSVLSEIPYDLALFEKIFHFQGQNIFFSLFIAAATLMLLQRYREKSLKGKSVRAVILLAGFAWVPLLKSENGLLIMCLTAVYYVLRKKENIRHFVLAAVISAFSIVNPLYMPAPIGLVIVYFYEKNKGKTPKYILSFYPLALASVFLISKLL